METLKTQKSPSGIAFAIISAIFFGLSTPFAKLLIMKMSPILVAGLLYFGSGIGLGIWLLFRPILTSGKSDEAPLSRQEIPWLCGAIIFGGMIAPTLLMIGLKSTFSSTASLMLNLESVFTLLLAWFIFHENFDFKILMGVLAIIIGSVILSWAGSPQFTIQLGPILIAGACLAWAIDNNLTRKISSGDPVQIAAIKGLTAGTTLIMISIMAGLEFGSVTLMALTCLLGLISYGLSLVFFVLSLRNLGTARTAAYFSLAPFVGAMASFIILGEQASVFFYIAAALMAIGIYFHISEHHRHEHYHRELLHQHRHLHDEHHRHAHDPEIDDELPHSHWHEHKPLMHSHPHYPDIHHRHTHN